MKTNRGGRKKSIFSRHFLQQSIAFFQQLLERKKHKTCSIQQYTVAFEKQYYRRNFAPEAQTYVVQIPRLHCFIQTFAEFLNFVLHFDDLYIRLRNKKDFPMRTTATTSQITRRNHSTSELQGPFHFAKPNSQIPVELSTENGTTFCS